MYSILDAGATLAPGAALTSPNGTYSLSYQADGDLVLAAGMTVLWSTGTHGKPVGSCVMRADDGRLELRGTDGKPVWRTPLSHATYAGSRLVLSDAGGLAIVQPDGETLWSPIACAHQLALGEVLMPGTSRLSANHHHILTCQRDGDVVLYSDGQPVWSTETRSHLPSRCVLRDSDGQLVVLAADGSCPWTTGVSGPACMDSHVELTDGGRLVQRRPDGQELWSRGRTVEPRYLICVATQEGSDSNERDSGDEIYLKVNDVTVWTAQEGDQPSMVEGIGWDHTALVSCFRAGRDGWLLVNVQLVQPFIRHHPISIRSLDGLRFPNVSPRSPLSLEVWEADGTFFAGGDDCFGAFVIAGTEDDGEGLGRRWFGRVLHEAGDSELAALFSGGKPPGACYILLYTVT